MSPAGAMRQKCSRVRTVADSLSHDADWLRHLGARELRTCLPVAACQSRHRFPLLGFCSADRGSSDSRGGRLRRCDRSGCWKVNDIGMTHGRQSGVPGDWCGSDASGGRTSSALSHSTGRLVVLPSTLDVVGLPLSWHFDLVEGHDRKRTAAMTGSSNRKCPFPFPLQTWTGSEPLRSSLPVFPERRTGGNWGDFLAFGLA